MATTWYSAWKKKQELKWNNFKHLVEYFVILGLLYNILVFWVCQITIGSRSLRILYSFLRLWSWYPVKLGNIMWSTAIHYRYYRFQTPCIICCFYSSDSLRWFSSATSQIYHCHVTWYHLQVVVYSRCYHKLELFLVLKQSPNLHLAEAITILQLYSYVVNTLVGRTSSMHKMVGIKYY